MSPPPAKKRRLSKDGDSMDISGNPGTAASGTVDLKSYASPENVQNTTSSPSYSSHASLPTLAIRREPGAATTSQSSAYQLGFITTMLDPAMSTHDSTPRLYRNVTQPHYRTVDEIPYFLRNRGGVYVTNLPTNISRSKLSKQFNEYADPAGGVLDTKFGFTREEEGEEMTAWLWVLYSLPEEAEHARSDLFAANIRGRQIEIEVSVDELMVANKHWEMCEVAQMEFAVEEESEGSGMDDVVGS